METRQEALPLGSTGRLEVLSLQSPTGDSAALVREDGRPRALLTAEGSADDRERVVITPLDTDVQVHVDGDALAVWLASGPLSGPAHASVPGWAGGLGLILLVLVVGLAVLGGATLFTWLLGLFGI